MYKIAIIGSQSTGKCLKKGSLVLTTKGLVKIEDLVNEKTDSDNKKRNAMINTDQLSLLETLGEYIEDENDNFLYSDNVKNIDEVASLSPKLKEGFRSYKITDRHDMGINDVIKINTTIGLEITGTPEHRIIVINKDGRLIFKKLENTTDEDYIVITLGTNYYNDRLKLNYIQKRYAGYGGHKTSDYILKNIDYMNEDIARLLGYIISEANASFNNDDDACSFSITTYDKEMQDDIINTCQNLGINWSYSYNNDYNTKIEKNNGNPIGIKISSINFAEFIYYLGYRHLAQNKEVPWSILQADKNSQTAFIRALFDGDGTVGVWKASDGERAIIDYGSASKKLCQQLQIVLLNMGIVGRLGRHKGATLEYRGETKEYEESYRLSLTGEEISKFAEIIGFGLARKKDNLNRCIKFLEDTTRHENITIPYIGDKLKILYNKLILLGQMKGLKIENVNEENVNEENKNEENKNEENENEENDSRIKFVAAKYYLEFHNCRLGHYIPNQKGDEPQRKPSNLRLKRFLNILKPVKESEIYRYDKNIQNIFAYLGSLSELFIFDKVDKIEKGRENVYDITIDYVHSYIANGMINHNTTIANKLSKKLNIPLITELARKWDIEKATQTELIHIQKELLKLQIQEENKNRQFISDRSTMDNLAYWLHNVSPIVDKEENESYVNTALDNVKNYSHIFLLVPEFYPVNDGFRNCNIIYQLQIAEAIHTILMLNNILHHRLSGTVENRVQKAMEILA